MMHEIIIGTEEQFVKVTVTTREDPDRSDTHIWLNSMIELSLGSFKGRYNASLLLSDFESFLKDLYVLEKTGKGKAVYEAIEEWLCIQIESTDPLGHFDVCIAAKDKSGGSNILKGVFTIDQTFLKGIVASIEKIIAEYKTGGDTDRREYSVKVPDIKPSKNNLLLDYIKVFIIMMILAASIFVAAEIIQARRVAGNCNMGSDHTAIYGQSGENDKTIEQARAFLLANGIDVKNDIATVEDINDWLQEYSEMKRTCENEKFMDRLKVLDNEDYQVVVFRPKQEKGKVIVGGVHRVFISDGNGLTFYGEK